MGERRLARVGDSFELTVVRRFLEIHPETPPEGIPIESLGYPKERWAQVAATLDRMGTEENILFAERTFTTNSHKALLLAVAVMDSGNDAFEGLNERLFRAYFCEGKNIGDVDVLLKIAEESGVSRETAVRAWDNPAYEERLRRDREAASRVGVTGIPTFLVGNRWIVEGAVPAEVLANAAQHAVAGR